MTSYARNLGMTNTTFKNASGLPNRAQLTTAKDIAILSHALISNFPDKYKLFNTLKFTYKGKTYKTHNKLMLSYVGLEARRGSHGDGLSGPDHLQPVPCQKMPRPANTTKAKHTKHTIN